MNKNSISDALEEILLLFDSLKCSGQKSLYLVSDNDFLDYYWLAKDAINSEQKPNLINSISISNYVSAIEVSTDMRGHHEIVLIIPYNERQSKPSRSIQLSSSPEEIAEYINGLYLQKSWA